MNVGVFGAAGRMGAEVCRAVCADGSLKLSAVVDPAQANKLISDLNVPSDLIISDNNEAMKSSGTEVAIDFTVAKSAVANIGFCIENGIHCVVGTTGISKEDLAALSELSKSSDARVLIAPNFAIGAVLMIRFAREAAKWMDEAEIIELHHPAKKDAPSGTSLFTRDEIVKASPKSSSVNIHSVRLPGLVAHQEVIFGGQGQTLTIRHDSIDRTSFMPGVILAVKKVASLPRGVTLGLENVLDG